MFSSPSTEARNDGAPNKAVPTPNRRAREIQTLVGEVLAGRHSYPELLRNLTQPSDAKVALEAFGVPPERMESSAWMTRQSKLPPEKGGINLSLAGFVLAIYRDERFGSFRSFVSWMNPGSELTWDEIIAPCKTERDFLILFQKLGIPGDKWRSSAWLVHVARRLLADPEATDAPLAGVAVALRKRFGSHPNFVAWMDKSNPSARDNATFLREELSTEEGKGLAVIAAHLGEAARAEYLCAKFQDRFPYTRQTIIGLRQWLGPVSVDPKVSIEAIPVGIFTIASLKDLRNVLFARMRDQLYPFYRTGLPVLLLHLERARARAEHPEQRRFIDEMRRYFQRVDSIPHPTRLKECMRDGMPFPAKHQMIVIEEVRTKKAILVADEMGAGKTGSAIASYEHLKDAGLAKKLLVLCPAQVASVWNTALSDSVSGCYAPGQAPRAAIIGGGFRDTGSINKAEVLVVSIEALRSESIALLAKRFGADVVVIDEAHNLKNPRGSDADNVFQLTQSPRVLNGHLILATGTPAPNTIRDVANHIRCLYAGRQTLHGVDVTDISSIVEATTYSHPLMARNILATRMLRRTTELCLPVGRGLHRNIDRVRLNPVERAQYDTIVGDPFLTPVEKINALKKYCLSSETKFDRLCAAVDEGLARSKYKTAGVPARIVVAEAGFARGVTRDHNDERTVSLEGGDYIASRLKDHLHGRARLFVLDGRNSHSRVNILEDFRRCRGPAVLLTLTTVAGEGLDLSHSADGVLISPTYNRARENQFSRRMNRLGQAVDVNLGILVTADTIEQGIEEFAERKERVAEDFLNGRPLTAEEQELLAKDITAVTQSTPLAYEALGPNEKVMWIISRLVGKGKAYIREFLERNDGRYARDFAAYYPIHEETSVSGNTARLVAGLIHELAPSGRVNVADIACGCRTLQRMFTGNRRFVVASSDINEAALDAGAAIIGGNCRTARHEVCAMDERCHAESSKDVAVISLALHYTRHNPNRREMGRERIAALTELKRILKPNGVGILTFPHALFADQEACLNFATSLERAFGLIPIENRCGLATAPVSANAKPYRVWVVTVRNDASRDFARLSEQDWINLSFAKVVPQDTNKERLAGKEEASSKQTGEYYDTFYINNGRIRFHADTASQRRAKLNYDAEVERYGNVERQVRQLIQRHGSIMDIPEHALLSISPERVNRATQQERDEYFRVLLTRYGSVNRVPVERISKHSPIILIRGESRRGPYVCLGRISSKLGRECGYGKRYFYEADYKT